MRSERTHRGVWPALLLLLSVLGGRGIAAASGPTVALAGVTVAPEPSGTNLLDNAGFEDVGPDGRPTGWDWDPRHTTAALRLDAGVAHHGHRSLCLTNQTPQGANVYGLLTYRPRIPLQAGHPYTLSAFVRGAHPGLVWLGGGATWQFRLYVPPTPERDGWRRIQTTFTPGPADTPFVLHIGTDSPTPGVWLDDLRLEAGTAATPDIPAGGPPELTPAGDPGTPGDGPWTVAFDLVTPQPLTGARLTATLGASAVEQPLSVGAGAWRVTVQGTAQAADAAPRTVALRLWQGNAPVVAAETPLQFQSPARAALRLAALRRRLPALDALLHAVQAKGQDPAYPEVSLTVLHNFVGYVDEDLHSPEVPRAVQQLDELEAMAGRVEGELRAALAGRRRLPDVPRWTGTRRPRVAGQSFLAPVVYPARRTPPVERPVFFVGYGAFGQVRRDIEKFPGYGANIIQIEIGPSAVFPKEGVVSRDAIKDVRRVLDRAAKAGVAVNLLVSPHYMPQWMLDKYPELRKTREGFLQYCLHVPEGQAFLQRYLHVLLPPLRDSPALHSICLSNEPINAEEPDPYAAADWHRWLQHRDGTISTLNARWGTHYARFADVLLPNPLPGGSPDVPRPSPLWAEFVRFNQEFFAGWHRMLAGVVRAAAPGVPIHAKPMAWTFLNEQAIRFGVDAELFGDFSDVNGNDSAETYTYGSGDFAQDFVTSEEAYDLQRSVRDAPVFNSENHVIPDRDARPVPPEHLRALLWQGALHGQGATTLWVWERTTDRNSDFYGNIMHHPAAAEAVGRVCHDLNRWAPEVTALQRVQPRVLLLQSVSAAVWDGPADTDCLHKLYTALCFTGLPVGFITERQLEAGYLPKAALLLVPNITHLSDAAVAALRRFPGRVAFAGPARLGRDEYGRPRPDVPASLSLPYQYGKTLWQDIWQALPATLSAASVAPPALVRDADGHPLWGVEWHCAPTPQGLLVAVCNYRNTPVTVTLRTPAGRPLGPGHDLLTGAPAPARLHLRPLAVGLFRFPGAGPRPVTQVCSGRGRRSARGPGRACR